ncbi:zinc finger protein 431-like [Aricia agestis]|uniref:zinc finger protein 431-like n=1 Tax=Aricia agestis TaxID=91739 RepID=UPI001C20A4CA|nr:zinc finger protein 431-like [Aricia agestis]
MVGRWLLMHLLHSRMKNRKKVLRNQNPTTKNTTLSVYASEKFTVKEEIIESENVQTCRVCLQSGEISIYNRNNEDLSWALATFGGIAIEFDDKYPKFLCTSCHELLQGAILLRKTAQQTDKLLRESKTENSSMFDEAELSDDKLLRETKTEDLSIFDKTELSDNNSVPDEKPVVYTWPSSCKTDHRYRLGEEKKRHNSSSDKCTSKPENLLENDEVGHSKNNSDPEENPVQKTSQLYCCKTCELHFNTFAEYSEHRLSSEHENKKRTCPICKKMFAASYLKRHTDYHKKDYQFICDICGKKFMQLANFTNHRVTHFHNFPFHCAHCPYKARVKDSLRNHMLTHTGEKPHHCTQCPARYASKSNLNKHMRTHKAERDHKCNVCERGFHTKTELEKHFKVDHNGIKDHVCDNCGKAFGYRKQLMKHKLKVHKRQKFKSGGMAVYLKIQSQDQEPCYQNNSTDA